MRMNGFWPIGLCLLFVLWAAPGLAEDQKSSACSKPGLVFAFANGVQTTFEDANESKNEFRRLFGEASPAGDAMQYEVLYNYSDGFEDFVETFEQRLREQEWLLGGRFELFFEALKGGGPWWERIIQSASSATAVLEGFVDWCEAESLNQLTRLAGNPPTIENYAEHRARVENWILEGKKLLIVAHSQGNLFANAAYDFALTKANASSVKLVHIAPASPTLRGPHTLADLDLVINGLRPFGTVAEITDSIPGYLLRPPGASGQTDILGHGLLEIYLNEQFDVSARVKGQINAAIASLVAPPSQAVPGFFTATLTWDGPGDADLHTIEPEGAHVYYYEPDGGSGYLDVDNIIGYGPEHYFASCDRARLQPGEYVIGLANYKGAEGRTATVQVASWNEGVLGTKEVVLGEATESYPSAWLFRVTVKEDSADGELRIDIEG